MSDRARIKRGVGVLELLDLDELQEAVYSLVVDQPSISAGAIATALHRSRRHVEMSLTALEDKGLVTRSAEKAQSYAATPPAAALNVLVLRRQEQLEVARVEAAAFEQRYRVALERNGASLEAVEVVVGAPSIVARARQISTAATREILSFTKPPTLADAAAGASSTQAELQRSLVVRSIYHPAFLETPEGVQHVRVCLQAGEQARAADVPVQLLIADREIAYVRLSGADDIVPKAMFVRSLPIVEALVALFEVHWERATRLEFDVSKTKHIGTRQSADSLSRSDRELLAFLSTGLKDEAIAQAMDITERTIGRRIQHLMAITGTRTRFQLGERAKGRGWLD